MKKKKIIALILISAIIILGGCEPFPGSSTEYRLITSVEGPFDDEENPGKIVIADTENTTPDKSYNKNKVIKLEAKPNYQNYSFDKWEVNGNVRRDPVLELLMNKDNLVKAYFTIEGPYRLITSTDPGEAGTIEVNPEKEYYENESVQITAKPNDGYIFSHWSGAVESADSQDSLTVKDERKRITAHFILESEKDKIVEFEDNVIEEKVREELNRPYGYILEGDIDDITKLDLASSPVNTLIDLPMFNNLKHLNLNMTETSDISYLSEIDDLEELYLAENNINDISSLQYLRNLRVLNLNDNNITDIQPLKNFKYYGNLQQLNLKGNNISDISYLSNISTLKVLNLNDNSIESTVELQNLKNLEVLKLSNNDINSIGDEFRDFEDLKILHLDHNQLVDISALGLFKYDSLEELNLDNNMITSFDKISENKNIKRIYLENNEIEVIPDLSAIENLDELHLTNNQIYNINGLSNMKSINELYLNENNLNDDPDTSINGHPGDAGVLLPVDPNETELTIEEIDLRDNPGLDGTTSQAIIERLEDSGTRVF